MQLFARDSCQSLGFGFADRAAIYGAQEKIQQALSRCGVVKYIADERGFRRFLDEVFQACGS